MSRRLSVVFALIGTLLSATVAAAGLTYTGPASIEGPRTGVFFDVCVPPIVCESVPQGSVAPSNLNPFADPAFAGIKVSGLTLVYSANASDNGKNVTLTWRASRPFDVTAPAPVMQNVSHLDGTVVYDPLKFTVLDLAMKTNFQDFDVDQTTLHTGPVPSGGSFDVTVPGVVMTMPLGPGAVLQFFAMTFTQLGANTGDTITLNLPSSVSSQPTPVTPVLPFAAFTARLEVERQESEFELAGAFTLNPASDGIDPVTEDVTLQIGTFSVTIPVGSFHAKKDKKGKHADKFTFEGVIDGVSLEVKITQKGTNTYEIKAKGEGADLTGVTNPVTVGLTIGDDGGSTLVTADIE